MLVDVVNVDCEFHTTRQCIFSLPEPHVTDPEPDDDNDGKNRLEFCTLTFAAKYEEYMDEYMYEYDSDYHFIDLVENIMSFLSLDEQGWEMSSASLMSECIDRIVWLVTNHTEEIKKNKKVVLFGRIKDANVKYFTLTDDDVFEKIVIFSVLLHRPLTILS
jgi:hypothetical protein